MIQILDKLKQARIRARGAHSRQFSDALRGGWKRAVGYATAASRSMRTIAKDE
jgi:hypothetical protein